MPTHVGEFQFSICVYAEIDEDGTVYLDEDTLVEEVRDTIHEMAKTGDGGPMETCPLVIRYANVPDEAKKARLQAKFAEMNAKVAEGARQAQEEPAPQVEYVLPANRFGRASSRPPGAKKGKKC